MESPTSSVFSTEPRTPISSTAEFSAPATPRTAYSVITPGFTPGTPFYDETSIIVPLKRLSFSTPALQPAPKRRKSHHQEQVELRRGSQCEVNVERRSEPERKLSIITYQPIDPFGSLELQRPIASGQWSKVCVATQTSTIDGRKNSSANRIFAAKVGIGCSAQEVLRHEARILTRLSAQPNYTDYIVGFEGYDLQNKGIILEYLPLTLEDWIQQLGSEQDEARRLERLRDELRPMALHLVKGLAFLHAQGIVHGDIKPANILLREPSDAQDHSSAHPTTYQPLFCDFTASSIEASTLSQASSLAGAGTYDFMAPELFSSTAIPTQASDVYALGITILTAVLSHSPYDGANNMFMRRAMAMNGSPFEFAGNSLAGIKLCNAMNVETWIGTALKRKAADRCTADAWVHALQQLEH